MKLKKVSIYLSSLMALAILFTTCYYLSYRHALSQFNKNSVERKGDFLSLDNKRKPSSAPDEQNSESKSVGSVPETILPTTKYILETFDVNSDKISREELNPPADFVGLTREQVIDKLSGYLDDITLSEYNKGLIAYELLSFSNKEVVIRKTYDDDSVSYRFYVVVEDGYVVVYNSDLKSVFNYTHIEAKDLPEEDRISLSRGIYIKSLDELYALLESYSS